MGLFDHDSEWWDRLTAGSPLWSSEGPLARGEYSDGPFPIVEPKMRGSEDRGASAGSGGAGRDKARSSWVLVGSLRESAQELALAPLPEDVDIYLAEAEELMFVRDRITSALADRVGRVHGVGQARQHGHASTRSWLRTAGGMGVAGAGRLLTLAVELARLPRVRAAFAEGSLAAGVVEAICTATAPLNDEQAGLAESILLELAGKAGPAEVAKAGRYLRAVLDPDGEERDEQGDYARRFLRVRPTRGGGLEGEFHLPREAAARLRALLDAYAKPRAESDDRPLRVRNADAFIALLEQEIATELLVLVNAESLPTDPQHTDPATDHAEAADPEDTSDCTPSAAENTSGCTPSGTGSADDPGDLGAAADPGTAETEAEAGAGAGAEAQADVAAGPVAESADRGTTAPRDEETRDARAGEGGSREQQAGERDTASAASGEGDDTAPPTATPPTAPPNTAQPDPPPDDPSGHHTHAGRRPAGDCRHGQATREDHGDVRCGQCHREQGPCGCGATPPWSAGMPGAVSAGRLPGTAPGLLLATGQMLPVTSVHRLARTSTLVRLVMDTDGQVLDMGRKVRLATPAQRRAVFARYATCWIDGCPLPATMCQIDHADNWSTGGLTDLKLLGPACQFHNRDRYRHPDRYTRRKEGTDRWAFTYHRLARARRLRV
ncbi:DUF222 domain-containing protein [Microbispora sp. NEAU-D428]|uniref:HNH endonuclease signature motif containing protein n=1 Tax=Microbispora sitophila TaxID=2771537 RepID=UPI001869487F|nr:HNH endonuclease signature motif containing protein [Microbispora sitophila]MBE3011733.1 DUF222 domain-containing protein [Microbispora sitophila]